MRVYVENNEDLKALTTYLDEVVDSVTQEYHPSEVAAVLTHLAKEYQGRIEEYDRILAEVVGDES